MYVCVSLYLISFVLNYVSINFFVFPSLFFFSLILSDYFNLKLIIIKIKKNKNIFFLINTSKKDRLIIYVIVFCKNKNKKKIRFEQKQKRLQ